MVLTSVNANVSAALRIKMIKHQFTFIPLLLHRFLLLLVSGFFKIEFISVFYFRMCGGFHLKCSDLLFLTQLNQ